MTYYHCSPTPGLTLLEPHSPKQFGKPARVYMTTSLPMALMYGIRNFEYTYGYTKSGEIYLEEYFFDAFAELYRGKRASLYLCAPETVETTQIPNEVVSDHAVAVLEEIEIPDVGAALLEQERLGNIAIRRFSQLSAKMREWIIHAEAEEIRKRDLLRIGGPMADYMRCHYPQSWALVEGEMTCSRLAEIRSAERASHEQVYSENMLFAPGSWLAKPVKTVLELLPLFAKTVDFRALDLGCGVGRNSIPVARAYPEGRVDCVDILDSAIERLRENGDHWDVSKAIRGIVSPIDGYRIRQEEYDLILAVSALEHVDSRESFVKKLEEIREGIRPGGVVCLVVNTGVREVEKTTGREAPPQFEVLLSGEEFLDMVHKAFSRWKTLKETTVYQKYDIPRTFGTAELETDVVTFVAQKE